MFGYATDETEECMPLTIVLAHKLNAKMAELRRNGTVPWLRPDSKTQVGSEYTKKYERSSGPGLERLRRRKRKKFHRGETFVGNERNF